MKQYIAKYYPLVDGIEKEYVTTVTAEDKAVAEILIREALVEQLERIRDAANAINAKFIGYDAATFPKDIEYARSKMRVVII